MKALVALSPLVLTSCMVLVDGKTKTTQVEPASQPAVVSATGNNKPKLILQLTVDQLRGDYLFKYREHFVNRGQKGFNYLFDNGILYANAHYQHGTTVTAVGHSTLATGATPSMHGVIGNNWFDPIRGEMRYCVQDDNAPLLHNPKKTGVSPDHLLSTTFSDELYLATGKQAKIFSVSIKDRGAILIGGHKGQSFWYDSKNGHFSSSKYYFDQLPEWVVEFNNSDAKYQYRGEWALTDDESSYMHKDDRFFERSPYGIGRVFPHKMPEDDKGYFSALKATPFGDKLTAEFAKHVVKTQQLGQGNTTDFLAVSFSVTDYIGHSFGPDSREAEDNIRQLDRTLADLFAYLDQQVGLENVLIALSADHGVDSAPEFKKSLGFPAGRFAGFDLAKILNGHLKSHYKIKDDLVRAYSYPGIYLDHDKVANNKLDLSEVKNLVAKLAVKEPIVANAVSDELLKKGEQMQNMPLQKAQNAYNPLRSGDVIVVPKESVMTYSSSAATHGTPYNYDTHVPVFFARKGMKPSVDYSPAAPRDLAVTLSAYMDIEKPSGANGKILQAVIAQK